MRLAAVDDAENLNGDERCERNEGDAAEGERHDGSRPLQRAAGTDRHGQHKGGDHCAACDTARVECDTREHGRRKEGEP